MILTNLFALLSISPNGLGEFELGKTYWNEAIKPERKYRPPIPDGTPTGEEPVLAAKEKEDAAKTPQEEEEDSAKTNAEDETGDCPPAHNAGGENKDNESAPHKTDAGSYKIYKFDYVDDEGRVTERLVETGWIAGSGGYGRVYASYLDISAHKCTLDYRSKSYHY